MGDLGASLSDFGLIVHRESGAVLDVRPTRPGGITSQDAFRSGVRVFLRKGAAPGALPGDRPLGQGWKYEGRKFVSVGGMRDSLVLTSMFVQSNKDAYAGYEPGGGWEVMLCNHEGSSNHTAEQVWDVLKDGTIRLQNDRSRCLAPAPKPKPRKDPSGAGERTPQIRAQFATEPASWQERLEILNQGICGTRRFPSTCPMVHR